MKDTKITPVTGEASDFDRWLNQAQALGAKDTTAPLPITLPLDQWMMLAELSARWAVSPGEAASRLLVWAEAGCTEFHPILEALNQARDEAHKKGGDQ